MRSDHPCGFDPSSGHDCPTLDCRAPRAGGNRNALPISEVIACLTPNEGRADLA